MTKNKLQLGIAGCMTALLLFSCLGDDKREVVEWKQGNCLIASFSLTNDSIPALKNLAFTIDQLNGEIYNKDSMPYGTVINRKVFCKLTYDELTPSNIEIYQEATGKQAYWNGSDSLDFSKFVRFNVFSYNGKELKTYTAKINIHQQKPDSMTWIRTENLLGETMEDLRVLAWNGGYRMFTRTSDGYRSYHSANAVNWTASSLNGLSGKTFILSQMTMHGKTLYVAASDGTLYRSTNGTDWSAVNGAPEIKALLGVVDTVEQSARPSALAAIVKQNDSWHFAAMNAREQWTVGDVIPTEFPVEGFANASYEAVFYRHLLLVGGKKTNGKLSNLSWETTDGLTWIGMNNTMPPKWEACEGAMLAYYDNQIYLIGGINASNTASKKIYRSSDRGVTWKLVNKLIVLPETYRARGYASVVVNDDKYMLLFGGKEKRNANVFDELWRGRINRLGFKE